jgi:hypothetical protein
MRIWPARDPYLVGACCRVLLYGLFIHPSLQPAIFPSFMETVPDQPVGFSGRWHLLMDTDGGDGMGWMDDRMVSKPLSGLMIGSDSIESPCCVTIPAPQTI